MSVSGTIAYCTREAGGHPCFAANLARLAQRHPDAKILPVVTNDVADGRNKAVLNSEGDWIWFIDPDMHFAPETLDRLLAHGVDVVQALCLRRHPPHGPIMWSATDARETLAQVSGRPGLYMQASVGAGGTLYRRRVFEAVPGPWFAGVLGVEDTTFAAKISAAGIKMFVDTATPVGHETPTVVWPEYDPRTGQWHVRYRLMNGVAVNYVSEEVTA